MASASINLVVLDVSPVIYRDRGYVTLVDCPAMIKRLTGERNKKRKAEFSPGLSHTFYNEN